MSSSRDLPLCGDDGVGDEKGVVGASEPFEIDAVFAKGGLVDEVFGGRGLNRILVKIDRLLEKGDPCRTEQLGAGERSGT